MTAHHIALDNQHRLLEQATADRLARVATAGRRSLRTRLLDAIRRGGARPAVRPAAHTARTGHA